jgi:cobalt-zinc-cadmium efflux system outer membrane protein
LKNAIGGARTALLALSLILTARPAPAEEPALTPERAVAIALAGNPTLAQIKARAEALAALPDQEGALADPSLSFEALNLPTGYGLNLHKEDMTMLEVGISQTIPFPGKRALKEQAATLDAQAAAHTVEEAHLRLARDVQSRWWQLAYMHRALAVIADTEKLLQQIIDIADARYRVGAASQQDALEARLALAKLGQERAQRLGMHTAEAARLNALLNRPANSPIRLPEEIDTRLPDLHSPADLADLAERARPVLDQRRISVEAARSRLELAEKEVYPDLTVGAGYAFRQDAPNGQTRSDFLNFRLSLNLPIYANTKQAAMVDQRQGELLKERYALEEAQRKVESELAAALATYHASREQFRLVEANILPLAQQTVTAALSGYQVGQSDFVAVLRAENAWFESRLQYWQAQAEARQALARLLAAVGDEAP